MSGQAGRYAPPRAALADAAITAPRRPVSLYLALIAIGINLAISVVAWWMLFRLRFMMQIAPSLLLWPFANWIVTILLGYQLWRGRNWARYLYLGMAALLVVSAVRRIQRLLELRPDLWTHIGDSSVLLRICLELLLAMIAVVLLFVPARAWFRATVAGN